MVTFNEKDFTIKVDTGICPVEEWLDTCHDIIDVLRDVDAELRGEQKYFHLLCLLKEMLPEWEDARKMGPTYKE